PPRRVPAVAKAMLAGAVLLLAAFIWEYTPVADLIDPRAVGRALHEFAKGPSAPFVVIGAFVVGGVVLFSVVVFIAATAATFGPLLGFIYAALGTILSALVTFAVGAWIGRQTIRDLFGPRLATVSKKIARKGVLAIAVVRMVPVAPFSVVNMLAGASEITLVQFMLGTILGMAPGILVMSVLGHQLSQIFLH